MIKRFYYTFWADIIRQTRFAPNYKPEDEQKFIRKAMLLATLAMGSLFYLIMWLIQVPLLHYFFGDLGIPFLGDFGIRIRFLNAIVTSAFYYGPVYLLNYFLVVRNKRYTTFIDDYKFYHGKLFAWTVFIMYGVSSIPMLIFRWISTLSQL
jgi:hypothetical protein